MRPFLELLGDASVHASAKARARWHESSVLTEKGAVPCPLTGLDEQREPATNHRNV